MIAIAYIDRSAKKHPCQDMECKNKADAKMHSNGSFWCLQCIQRRNIRLSTFRETIRHKIRWWLYKKSGKFQQLSRKKWIFYNDPWWRCLLKKLRSQEKCDSVSVCQQDDH